MGQKLKIWATMTSIILLSGMLGFGFSPDALATHNDKGESKAKGCELKNENGNTENNPHCVDDTPPDPLTNCDLNLDGVIDLGEIIAANPPITPVDAAIALAGADGNTNGIIDNQGEVDTLNLNALINCV